MELQEQGIRYLLAGGWNTVFGYSLFAGATLLFGDEINYLILLVFTTIIATLNAFVVYRVLVFKVRDAWLRDLARFSVVYLCMLAANLALLPLLVEVAGFPVLLAQAILLTVTVVSSFFAHRNFSFRRISA